MVGLERVNDVEYPPLLICAFDSFFYKAAPTNIQANTFGLSLSYEEVYL